MFIKPLILQKMHSKDVKIPKEAKKISNSNLKAFKEKEIEQNYETNKKLRLNDELNINDPIDSFLKKDKKEFDFGKVFYVFIIGKYGIFDGEHFKYSIIFTTLGIISISFRIISYFFLIYDWDGN